MLPSESLRVFVELCRSRGFTAAARRLGMTQPGVSQHLRRLEDEYATVLIDRGVRRFEITEAGARLLAFAERLGSDYDELKRGLAKDDPRAGVCRFASPGSFGMVLYTALLDIAEKNRELVIHYSYAPNSLVLQFLRDDRIDVGFVTEPVPADFDFELRGQERLCLIAPAEFRYRGYASLRELGFVGHPDGAHHATRLLQANFAGEFGGLEEIPLRAFNNQITRIPEAVARGFGFTVLPEFACRAFPDRRQIRFIKLETEVEDPIFRVWRKGRRLPARFDFLEASVRALGRGRG